MKSLAVIVSGGSTNNFIQVMTLLMAAVHSDMTVRVLFRDESIRRITREGIASCVWSSGFDPAPGLEERLRKLELEDLHRLCQDIKASGDVKYYACTSSLALLGIRKEELIPEIDAVRGLPAFLLEDVNAADRVLTF